MNTGKLIVFEGLDRSGKSTQIKLLQQKYNIVTQCFPDRESETGKILDKYLKSEQVLIPEVVYLLFSANRWEKSEFIKQCLQQNKTLILDRYYYSGIAYSTLDVDKCVSDRGLPEPDIVFYMDIEPESIAKRSGFGSEKYETIEKQKKVKQRFMYQKQSNWVILDAELPAQQIHEIIESYILKF